jgi:hypothetical protein
LIHWGDFKWSRPFFLLGGFEACPAYSDYKTLPVTSSLWMEAVVVITAHLSSYREI